MKERKDKLDWTQIEVDYGRRFTKEDWAQIEALDEIAKKLVRQCVATINLECTKVGEGPIRYKAQHTLETLIGMLQAKV